MIHPDFESNHDINHPIIFPRFSKTESFAFAKTTKVGAFLTDLSRRSGSLEVRDANILLAGPYGMRE